MKAQLMTPSKFLKKEDIEPAKLVTVKSIRQTNVGMDDGPEELKWTMSFRELDKPMVLNSTNIQLCIKVFDTDETDDWIGRLIVLYNDPNVSFAGKITGGIRVRSPKKGVVAPQADAPPPQEEDFTDEIPF